MRNWKSWVFIPVGIIFGLIALVVFWIFITTPQVVSDLGGHPSATLRWGPSLDPAVEKSPLALKEILQDPDQQSLHESALYDLFAIAPVGACKVGFALNDAGKLTGNERTLFVENLDKVITIENLPHIDPAELQKIAASDHYTELAVCEAFLRLSQYYPEHAIPWFEWFLGSSDPEIQNYAKSGMMFCKGERDYGSSISSEPHPEEVLAPYKAWGDEWIATHPQYAIPKAPPPP